MPIKPNLIEQIEQDALDGSTSLAGALRKCISLGGHAGSVKLRDWASRELNGYGGSDVPDYRKIVAPIVIDGVAGHLHITGEQISALDLPKIARDAGISEELVLLQGVRELEDLTERARTNSSPIRLGLPGGAELATLMTHEMASQFRAVERIYWNVSPTAVVGVLDQIRTRLVAIVAEVRTVAADTAWPSSEAVTNAVEVVVYGKARDIHINAAQSSGAGPATVELKPHADRPWWRRVRVIGAFLVGLATIAATIIIWVQWRT